MNKQSLGIKLKSFFEQPVFPPIILRIVHNIMVARTWVPTVILGIDEIPALDFGFLFFALAFSSIFFRWLKGTTPLEENN